jgi:uncharacterized membrane-anchored protein
MDRKKILILAFALMVSAQFYVPLSMIWESEGILSEGTPYKFRTAPIDPNDPFRGKYITLEFKDNICDVKNDSNWIEGEMAYGIVENLNGFAHITSLTKSKPKDKDYLHLRINYLVTIGEAHKANLAFPFKKYYMEESKAYAAERIYRERQLDTIRTTYALVYVKDGVGRLADVKIGDSSIQDMAK